MLNPESITDAWTPRERNRAGWFAAVGAALAVAALATLGFDWFSFPASGPTQGVDLPEVVAAAAPLAVGVPGSAPARVPQLFGIPAAALLLVATALLTAFAAAARTAVLLIPAAVMWLATAVMSKTTAAAVAWPGVGPATPDIGWALLGFVHIFTGMTMVAAAVFITRTNQTHRRNLGTSTPAAINALDTIVLRGAGGRADSAASSATLAGERSLP